MTAKHGKLIAVIDAGEPGGPAVSIGELRIDGVELGEVKIPAGVHAVLRVSQSHLGVVQLESSASIADLRQQRLAELAEHLPVMPPDDEAQR